MRKIDLDDLKMVLPGKVPFANAAQSSESGSPGIITPDAESGQFSMPDGFGVNFDAAPTATGAEMVQRGQINYIGKMASYAQFMGQCGKGYWGFDPEVCTAIDGYPEGAILTLVEGGCYLKIVSLHDNNTVDFTGRTNTTDYPKITNGTVDGVNWQYLSLDPKTLLDQSVIAEIAPFVFSKTMQTNLSAFKANMNSAIVVEGGIEVEVEEKMESYGIRQILWGVAVVLSPPFDSLNELNGWTPSGESGNKVIYSIGTWSAATEQAILTKDKYYGIGLTGTSWAPDQSVHSDWSLWVKVLSSTIKIRMLSI